ncbi:alpha-L-iduronidase isoform X1 [Zophobas morio]|uniref:alpha-L-iduronidase isoform X1 n=2 Tax=Zophobas morio TaxID=2755281 RepID=UPI003082BA0B
MHTIIIFLVILAYSDQTEITVDTKSAATNFDHFWESTGLCPPDPKEDIYKFLLSEDEKFNLALIGALPNQGIKQVRIHWLFDLIFYSENGYNFTYLDDLLDFLVTHNLKPRFELMGYPILVELNKERDFWHNLVENIATRYISKFGASEVSQWKFELWNEPDLTNYNLLNFTLSEYLEYVTGCAEGLKGAFGGQNMAILGGPAGLFREENHPLCWGLLEACSNSSETFECPIQFLSFHRKGDGTAQGVLNGTLELLDSLRSKFPSLVDIPIANDESDIITTWSHSWEWRGDSRYAAMVVKVISDHYKSVTLDRKTKIELLGNDNGFLNYHPFYFTQRTLFARFQMNHTHPPHNQFIKKPVYTVMGLLSFLGDGWLQADVNPQDPLLTVLATKTVTNGSNLAILLAYGDDDYVNDTIKPVQIVVKNVPTGGRFVVYLLDNVETNPYKFWQDVGGPVFPQSSVREEMRKREGPLRLFPPTPLTSENLTLTLNLTIPSVALVHVCPKPTEPPGPVTKLSVFNVTRSEIFLTWSDSEIATKCVRTYEVEFEAQCSNSLQFIRINPDDGVFLSYHYAPPDNEECESTVGRYRVRAIDYWDQPGNYSQVVVFPY